MDPTDMERQGVERKLNQKFSGSGNSETNYLNDGKETTPEVVPLNTGDNDDNISSCLRSRKFSLRIESRPPFGVKASLVLEAIPMSFETRIHFIIHCIKPFNPHSESLDQLFRINGIDSLDIYFKTLKPADSRLRCD